MARSILIVEDEQTLGESLKRIFSKEGFDVDVVASAEACLGALESTLYDLIISDIMLPGMDGIELLARVRQELPGQIFIVMTAYASLETAVKALRGGAYDYIMKPIIHEEIKQVVRNAFRQSHLLSENVLLKREIAREYNFSSIIGSSPEIHSIIDEVRKIADTKSSVLLLGETGTGKELFARVIHHNSSRREMPFVPINCATIPEQLLESELFGHLKGAFTGALISKKGLFEEADGGTVFLDEIGDISPSLQVKLLRVLEDQMIRPVGSTKSSKVDIRFITATNRDLLSQVRSGSFREDLYYRINTITLKIPPLRDRREDIPLLVMHFMKKYSRELGKPVTEISPEAVTLMSNYDWPGNVREIQNIIERAILITEGTTVREESLPDAVRNARSVDRESLSRKLSIEEYTRTFIQRHQSRYTETQLAEMLGITRKSLWEKRKKWNLTRE